MTPPDKLQELCVAKLAELEHDCVDLELETEHCNSGYRELFCKSLLRDALRELLTKAGVIGGTNG